MNDWVQLKLIDNNGGACYIVGTHNDMTDAYENFQNAKRTGINDLLEIQGCTDEIDTKKVKFSYMPDEFKGAFLTWL